MKPLDDIKKIVSLVGGQLKSTFQMLSYLKKMKQRKVEDQQHIEAPIPKGKKGKATPPKLNIPENETAKKKKTPVPLLNILNDEPSQESTSWWSKAKKCFSFLKLPNKDLLSNPYIAGILMFLLLAISVFGFWLLLEVAFPTPSTQTVRPSVSTDQLKEESKNLKEESLPQNDTTEPEVKNEPSAPQVPVETPVEESTKEKTTEETLEKTTEEAPEKPSEETSPTAVMNIKIEPSSDEHIPYQPPLDLEKRKGFIRTINPHFFVPSPPVDAKGVPYNISPRIGIIVYDVGINELETDILLSDLPEEVTFSLSPYAAQIDNLIEDVKNLGHTVLIQMPWEDEHVYTDQGNLTVCTGLTQEKLMEILNTYKGLSKTADGLFAQGGGKLMLYPDELSLALKFIVATKNCLVAPPDVLMTSLHECAAKEQVNYVSTSILSPKFRDIPAIESLAKRTGFAILAFPTSPQISAVIEEWIDRLEELNIDVVPLSKIIREKK